MSVALKITLGAIAAALATALIIWFIFRSDWFILSQLEGTLEEQQLAQTDISDLPDGVHVLICGAGGPLPDAKRSGPCVAVQAGQHLYVIDAGSNGVRNLMLQGVDVGRIEALLITHGHSDHIDGMGELGVMRWTNGGHDSPLPVHGPSVINEIVAGINIAYGPDARYRTEHHGEEILPASGKGLSAKAFPWPEGDQVARVIDTRDGVSVKAFAVDHSPVNQAVGYRIEYKDKVVVVSGDTKRSANLQLHARGADLLIHEAIGNHILEPAKQVALKAGDTRRAKLIEDIVNYHATPVEAAEIAAAANVRHLVFYHIIPPLPVSQLEDVFLSGVDDVYDGKVTLSRDGTLISLPLVTQVTDSS